MKKNKFTGVILVTIITSAAIFIGCNSGNKKSENPVNNNDNNIIIDNEEEIIPTDETNLEMTEETDDSEEGKGDYLSDLPYVTITEQNYDVKDENSYYLEYRRDEVNVDSVLTDVDALSKTLTEYNESNKPTQEYIDEIAGYAKEDLEFRGDDFPLDPDIPYYSDTIDISVARVDTKVLSLKSVNYMFTGGAHGSAAISGDTFDVESGKRLSITDVFKDYEGFIKLLKEESKEQAIIKIGLDGLFNEYEETIDSMDLSTMTYDAWYLDAAGFVYTFGDYEIAPHASGLLEVDIEYEKLTSYINSDYLPSSGDRISLVNEGTPGCISLVNGNYVYYSNEREDAEDTNKGIISIGADSKVITDNGYISDAYLMSRLDKNYVFINYLTDYDSDNPRNNFAVIDVTDGIKIIYEESDEKILFTTLNMDDFSVVEKDGDNESPEERYIQVVLGE